MGGGGGKSGGSSGASRIYYASIAGINGVGPLDFVSSIVVDEQVVWPASPVWPASLQIVPSAWVQVLGDGVSVYIGTQSQHGLSVGDSFTSYGFTDPRMNVELGTVISTPDAWTFGFTAALGSTLAKTDFTDGFVSKVNAFSPGDLRRIGPVVYQCILAHSATEDTKPYNATYWKQYRLSRTDAGVTNPVKITVAGHGDLYIYWGTPTQTLDATYEAILTRFGHPAYRDQSITVLQKFLQGLDRNTEPTVRIMGGRTPIQSVVTGAAATLDGEGQANPICVIAELLTHPIWGISANLDATTFQAAADWCLANSTLTYISPLLNQQAAVPSAINDILESCDCWLRFNADGAIECGHWPHDEAAPAFAANKTVNWNQILKEEEIETDTDLWDGTANKTTVKYQDQAHAFNDRPAIASNLANRVTSGRVMDRNIERPHVTRANQALAIATRDIQIASRRFLSGKIKVRADAVNILPGDLFLLTNDMAGSSMVCRCTDAEFSAPPDANVDLTWQTERGISPVRYRPTPISNKGMSYPHPVPIRAFRILQAPPGLAGDQDFHLTLLAGRSGDSVSQMDVWFRQADGSAFYQVATVRNFGCAGALAADFAVYTDTDGVLIAEDATKHVDVTLDALTPIGDIEAVLQAQTLDAANDNALLLWIVDAADSSKQEICVVLSISALGGGTYRAVVRRSQFGTKQGADGATTWGTGAFACFIPRVAVNFWTHAQIETLAESAATIHFRLVPSTPYQTGDINDLYDPTGGAGTNAGVTVATDYTSTDIFPPLVKFISLTVGGSAIDWSANHDVTDTFTAAFQVSSLTSPLATVILAGQIGGTESALASPTAAGLPIIIRTLDFKITSDGDWGLVIRATNQAGRSIQSAWPNGGSAGVIKIRAGSSLPLPPTMSYSSGYVTLACATGGSAIEYMVSFGYAPGEGGAPATSIYSAPFHAWSGADVWARSRTGSPGSYVYSAWYHWTL